MRNKIKMINKVNISLQYQKSIRIDSDFLKKESLDGFIFHETANSIISNIATQFKTHKQSAFTLTGPYGGGKSSLVLALVSSICCSSEVRAHIKSKMKPELSRLIDSSFPIKHGGWNVIPIVGGRSCYVNEIVNSINENLIFENKIDANISPSELIKRLIKLSDNNDGLVLVFDEMGKFLEEILANSRDVHFFQEIAEAASRSDGKLIILGVLHQSFRQYALRYGQNIIDEWSKIQGRYSDLPVIVGNDEVVDLIANAIRSDYVPNQHSVFNIINDEIKKNRPSIDDSFLSSLQGCWPLHPVMAVMLSSVSRKQYSQNDRSIFTFLSSAEIYGFQDFLKNHDFDENICYRPHDFWSYIRANLESTISASSDSHKWAQAIEAVERVEFRADSHDKIIVMLVKTIAIINIFKSGTGLHASNRVLKSIYFDFNPYEIDIALKKLDEWKVIIFRKYMDAWSIFDGSDFDFDKVLTNEIASIEKLDTKELLKIACISPVIAKKHYYKTGTLRKMSIIFANEYEYESIIKSNIFESDSFGRFVIIYGSKHSYMEEINLNEVLAFTDKKVTVLSIASESNNLYSLGKELVALNRISSSNHDLESDSVARKEIEGRLNAIKNAVEKEVNNVLLGAKWFFNGGFLTAKNLSSIASEIAEKVFCQTPIINSEIINRERISSSAVKARRELLHKMVSNSQIENLGINDYPAERGLYEIILKNHRIHSSIDSTRWEIVEPSKKISPELYQLWKTTDNFLDKGFLNIFDLYRMWSLPPFGIQKGMLPILCVAYFLSRDSVLSLYKDNVLLTDFGDVEVDELLQTPNRFTFKKVVLGSNERAFLLSVKNIIESKLSISIKDNSPLEIARGLVRVVYSLPGWTKVTNSLSTEAKLVRDKLLEANDPYKILFVDLKNVLNVDNDFTDYLEKIGIYLAELIDAYPSMLFKFKKHLSEEIGTIDNYFARQKAVSERIHDSKFKAFLARLGEVIIGISGPESILTFLLNKPLSSIDDNDISLGYLTSTEWITRFKHLEAYLHVDNNDFKTNVIALVTGAGKNTKTTMHKFIIDHEKNQQVEVVANDILKKAKDNGLDLSTVLAAVTKLSQQNLEGEL